MNVRERWLRLTDDHRSAFAVGGVTALLGVIVGIGGAVVGLRITGTVFMLAFFAASYVVFAEYSNNPTDVRERVRRGQRLFIDGVMLVVFGGGALVLLYGNTVTPLAPEITQPVPIVIFGIPTFSTGLFAVLAALAVSE